MSNWNDLSRDRLINEYRKYPCLWSTKNEDSKNTEKRRECLNMIMEELNKNEEKPFNQEEVRTQFKNLRDMYRRKRKKLQTQQEVNPAAAIDEPGWVYFSRLKFLDDTVDFSPPNESPPPPPKKKGKSAPGRPSADDGSLPTPLEENSGIPQPSNSETPPTTEVEQRSVKNEEESSARGVAIETECSQSQEVKEEESMDMEGEREEPKEAEECHCREQARANADESTSSQIQPTHLISSANASHRQGGPFALLERKKGEEVAEDEFACFGRFVAMTLRKISSRSPVGALEARKEIGDVLYRAELGSLTR